ncbi:MAG: UDP-N-acetylmuramate dehydrogenase [Gammaproteobacteria bacterium]|nr:UDP-N-acetylmuramate dehydrogenase [Gammaproteobacteria bacterium]
MSLDVKTHYPLQPHNTFAIECYADTFIEIASPEDLGGVVQRYNGGPFLVLGGGSNLLFDQSQIHTPVLWANLKGIELLETRDNEVIVRAMAGENWHEFVQWCLQRDYGGLENLSLIPGSVGAAPVQNIGAYGVEVKDTLYQVEAFNLSDGTIRHFSAEECQFAYRDSFFKHAGGSQWIIVSVSFRLSRHDHQLKLDYGAIRTTLEAAQIISPTIRDVSEAVVAIRRERLPDPRQTPNAGSFFKNPITDRQAYEQLIRRNPEMPCFELADGQVKIPAGWLIEQCGWKGGQLGNAAVHEQHALVLVNLGGATGDEIMALAGEIQNDVKLRFGVMLELEVNPSSRATPS